MCRLIDQYMKKHTLEGPLTNTHLVRLAIYIVELLQSFEVRAMYGEKTFVEIDVEYDDLYGYYVRTLARRYFDAWYHRNVFGDPLTEDHVRDLLGDFQDLIWGAYGDDAIKVD